MYIIVYFMYVCSLVSSLTQQFIWINIFNLLFSLYFKALEVEKLLSVYHLLLLAIVQCG